MKKIAFISRHVPTADQLALAAEQDMELIHVGDADAFSVCPDFVTNHGVFDGVAVVHPAAAMRLASSFLVAVFENSNRAAEGEKPQFFAKALHVYDMRV
jgi:hypothetical protein